MSKTIRFKSNPENYRKEYLGIKNNTMRFFEDNNDVREEVLADYMSEKFTNLFIEIENNSSGEYFVRPVTDVTYWRKQYIITWEHTKLRKQ